MPRNVKLCKIKRHTQYIHNHIKNRVIYTNEKWMCHEKQLDICFAANEKRRKIQIKKTKD